MEIKIPRSEEETLLKQLGGRMDAEAARIKRYLAMPDLARTPVSPLAEMVKRVKAL
jgi:hypothetical protein